MLLAALVLIPFLGSLLAAVMPAEARNRESWLAKQRERMLAEDGMSETIQNVLWAIFAIAIVGIVAAIIQAYVVGKANEIR